MNIQCTVSETNFVYGCSLLRIWSIQSIQSHSLGSKWPHWSLNSKDITFLTKKLAWNATFWVLKLQTYFLYKLLLIGCDIFAHIIVFCLSWYLHLKHVPSLDFNNSCSSTCFYFKRLNNPGSSTCFYFISKIMRDEISWNLKIYFWVCEIFSCPILIPSTQFFQFAVCIYKIHVFDV